MAWWRAFAATCLLTVAGVTSVGGDPGTTEDSDQPEAGADFGQAFLAILAESPTYGHRVDVGAFEVISIVQVDVCTEPVIRVLAKINQAGKEVAGYFRTNGDFVGTHFPDWFRLVNSKIGCRLESALQRGMDPIRTVHVAIGAGSLGADVAGLIETIPGITSIELHGDAPYLRLDAAPEAIHALAEVPQISWMDWWGVDPNLLGLGTEPFLFIDDARDAVGSDAARARGVYFEGSGNIAVYDTGFPAFSTSDGLGSLPAVQAGMDFTGENLPAGRSTDNHGSQMAYLIHGQHSADLHGLATKIPQVKLFNARILSPSHGYSPGIFYDAMARSHSERELFTPWQISVGSHSHGLKNYTCANVGCTAVFDTRADKAALEMVMDYWVFTSNRFHAATAGDWRPYPTTDVVAPGTAANALTVGAFDDHNDGQTPSGFTAAPFTVGGRTNAGLRKPDLAAPGVGILTADRTGMLADIDGTSPSTAIMAGAAAQVNYPRALEKKCALLSSADRTSWDSVWGWGVPNVDLVADGWTRLNSQVVYGLAHPYLDVYIPSGKEVHAFLVWKEEYVSDGTFDRISDLDLHLNDFATGATLTSSLDATDVVEAVFWENTGSTTKRARLVVEDVDLADRNGLQRAQQFTLCYELH